MIDTLLIPAGMIAALIVATTEAIRARVPKLDGWPVLAVAACLALAWCALLLPIADVQTALDAGRIAAVAWLLAVGGDSWVAKLAGKSATVRTVIARDADTMPAPPPEPEP